MKSSFFISIVVGVLLASIAAEGFEVRHRASMGLNLDDGMMPAFGKVTGNSGYKDLYTLHRKQKHSELSAKIFNHEHNYSPSAGVASMSSAETPWMVQTTEEEIFDGNRAQKRLRYYLSSNKKSAVKEGFRNGGPTSQQIQAQTTNDKSELQAMTDQYSRPFMPVDLSRLALRHLIKEAEMVFIGVVEQIDYRTSSARDKDDAVLPHTFVTFKIEEVFKGRTASNTITLRFQGGRTEVADAKFEYLTSPEIPLFDLADRDILFIRGNCKSICPLVGMKKGRLRVIDNHIYTDDGRPIGFSEDLQWSLPFLRNDIIQANDLFDRLLRPRDMHDKHISSIVAKAVHESMQAAIKAGPHSAAEMYAKVILAKELNEITGINNVMLSLDPKRRGRATPQIIPNRLLSKTKKADSLLRKETRRLLVKGKSPLSLKQGAILNRLLLEDLYNPYFVRSLKTNLVILPFRLEDLPLKVQEAVNIHEAFGKKLTFMRIEKGDTDPDQVSSKNQQRSKGKNITEPSLDEFLKYIKVSVQNLHTKKELMSVPSVVSALKNEPFYIKAIKPVCLKLDVLPLQAEKKKQKQLDRLEEEAMIKSGFNPVLKPRKIK